MNSRTFQAPSRRTREETATSPFEGARNLNPIRWGAQRPVRDAGWRRDNQSVTNSAPSTPTPKVLLFFPTKSLKTTYSSGRVSATYLQFSHRACRPRARVSGPGFQGSDRKAVGFVRQR